MIRCRLLILFFVVIGGCIPETEYVPGRDFITKQQAEAYRNQQHNEEYNRIVTARQQARDANSLETFEAILERIPNRNTSLREEIAQIRREWYTHKHTDIPAPLWQYINEGKVGIGMTTEQSRAAWGEPTDINRTGTASGIYEQWVYRSGSYLYFENGILTSWQN